MAVTIDEGPHDGPDRIGNEIAPKRTFGDRLASLKHSVTTREGLLGAYDYGFLFTPTLPFMKKPTQSAPFFTLQQKMPVVLGMLLGFQHTLAMLAGVVTPPILISLSANFDTLTTQYLVSTSLIVCGILSTIQITRFHIKGTPYFVGTGLISVVGTSFAIIPVATKGIAQMYANGMCKTDTAGKKLPCPDAYGAILGTAALCALLEIGLSFMTPKTLKRLFPPIVTGPTVMLIGVHLTQPGLQNWAGGAGPCMAHPEKGIFALCPTIFAPHALPWGSAEYIGLGFSVFLTIILCERFGAPIMKSMSVVIGLLTGCIIAAACGYFDKSSIDKAPAVSFIWKHTFHLSIYGPLVLPMLAIYLICMMEAIGDITATCDVSRLQVEGDLFDSRIQGGILADGINGMLAALCTTTPMSTFAQNNGVIALTRCANRTAGYWACFFLITMGLFSKFAAALVAIPSSVLGGMTTFLFTSVAVSGLRIISTVPFTRRTRFILTASLALGVGSTLVPNWFDYVFTYTGTNKAKAGFFDAIVLVMETGFAITALIAVLLNLLLPEETKDEVAESLAGEVEEEHRLEDLKEVEAEKENGNGKVGVSSSSAAVV